MENKGIILYAEDREGVRIPTEGFFNAGFPDYNLEVFEDGTSLKNRLEQDLEGVKLIFTDNEMPGIYGGEIINQYSKKLNIPFILGFGDIESIGREAVENGAFDYILKPFLFKEFCDLIQKALDSYKK